MASELCKEVMPVISIFRCELTCAAICAHFSMIARTVADHFEAARTFKDVIAQTFCSAYTCSAKTTHKCISLWMSTRNYTDEGYDSVWHMHATDSGGVGLVLAPQARAAWLCK